MTKCEIICYVIYNFNLDIIKYYKKIHILYFFNNYTFLNIETNSKKLE